MHPEEYRFVPKCVCGAQSWRVEFQAKDPRPVCYCDGPSMLTGRPFPHRHTHWLCDNHPHGFYNQAKVQGVDDEDIPVEYRPNP